MLMRVASDTPRLDEGASPKGEGSGRSFVSTAQAFLPAWGREKGRKVEERQRPPKGKSLPSPAHEMHVQDEDPLGQSPDLGVMTAWSEGRDDGGPEGARQSDEFLQRSAEMCRLAGALLASVLTAFCGVGLRLAGGSVRCIRGTWRWIRYHHVPERLAKGGELALVGTWAASKGLAVRILPERHASSTTYGASARPMAKARVLGFAPSLKSRLLIAALIILGVSLAVTTSALRIKWRLDQAELEKLTTQVEETLMLAERQEDWEAKVALLSGAQELIDQATDGYRDSPEVRELSERLESQWVAATGGVRVAFGPEPMLAVPEGVSRRLVVQHDQLYILDEMAQRLYRYDLDQQGDLATDQGPWTWESSREAGSIPTERIVDMTWVDAASGRLTPALLMVTSGGSLVELKSNGDARNVSVSDIPHSEDVRAVRTYEGNLYILDVGGGNIIKYIPTGDDYRDPPVGYIANPEGVPWDSVIDMAIDGSIYLLLTDGTIMKFTGGHPQPFPQEGLHPPVENPVALFASPGSASVFVAEPDQSRIVEFTTDGRFIRQFGAMSGRNVPLPLANLQAFEVDLGHDRLLIGTGAGVFSTPLPPVE